MKKNGGKDSVDEYFTMQKGAKSLQGDCEVFEIRQADESDIPDLVELDDRCFDVYYYENTKFSRSDFQSYFRLSKPILLVATRDSRLVGYVAGKVRSSEGLLIAHLDSIAVSFTERRQGFGGDLLQHFIEQANRWGCSTVVLEVAKANEEGLDFLSKREFRSIANLPEYYGRDIDGVLMERKLSWKH
jgi:ribosomal protein S18 acetylase RimI-like enzyme